MQGVKNAPRGLLLSGRSEVRIPSSAPKRNDNFRKEDCRFFLYAQTLAGSTLYAPYYNLKQYLFGTASSFGGHEGSRTLDLCNANAALSQLSYAPLFNTNNNITFLQKHQVKKLIIFAKGTAQETYSFIRPLPEAISKW